MSKDTKVKKNGEKLGQNLFLILIIFRVPSVVTIQAPAGIGKSSMLKYGVKFLFFIVYDLFPLRQFLQVLEPCQVHVPQVELPRVVVGEL